MKISLFLSLLFICTISWSQTDSEQNLFNHNIWKTVPNDRGAVDFYDSEDVFLGGKKNTGSAILYFDRRKRVFKKIALTQPKNKKKKVKAIKNKKSSNFKNNRRFVKHGNYFVRSKRNKTIYYDTNGNLVRTVRKKGNTIYYKNSEGKLVGYKKLGRNGFVEYRDVRGRKTGTSTLNSAGFVVYKQYKRRNTLSFMISDAYFF